MTWYEWPIEMRKRGMIQRRFRYVAHPSYARRQTVVQ
jgi:hypothetical protein